MYVL
jgi:hypothetical protein